MAEPRDKALQDYRKKLLEHKEIDGRLKERECLLGDGEGSLVSVLLLDFIPLSKNQIS